MINKQKELEFLKNKYRYCWELMVRKTHMELRNDMLIALDYINHLEKIRDREFEILARRFNPTPELK